MRSRYPSPLMSSGSFDPFPGDGDRLSAGALGSSAAGVPPLEADG
ncbi:hypothetical protein [Streptomyces smyrnaeus]|nr:hypothetical protein [Streptomyces smyrnaeus]